MKNVLEGINFYEIILIALGTLLFLTLLFGLIYFIIKGRNIKKLLVFFLLPIIMIACPSIQKVGFENGMFQIEKYTQDLENNPGDTVAINELTVLLDEYEEEELADPETIVAVGEAYSVLGDDEKAMRYVEMALHEDPNNKDAILLKSKIEYTESIETSEVKDTLSTINSVGFRDTISSKVIMIKDLEQNNN